MDMEVNYNGHTDVLDGPDHVIGFDRYGFAIFDEAHKPDAERCHRYSRLGEDKEQLEQWQKVLVGWKTTYTCLGIKVQTMIRQGVPQTVRPILWKKLLDTETLRATSPFNYQAQLTGVREQLVDHGFSEYSVREAVNVIYELETTGVGQQIGHISFDCLRQILLDLDRSYPTNRRFMADRQDGIEGKAALFRVLATYARYNPEVSYCQGMSYIGGLLLMVMEDEEEVFWALVSLLERFKFLRGYYDDSMERIQRHVNVFDKLIKEHMPTIHNHLKNLGITAMMFTTPWFLCLYTNLPCWETVLAIWDLFMLDGAVTIFRVGLSILDVMQEGILAADDMSDLLPILLHPPDSMMEYLPLMPAIYDTHLEDWEVAKLEAIVMEETGVMASRKRRCHNDQSLEPRTKRRHTAAVEENDRARGQPTGPSLFRRFVNMFTPQDQVPRPKSHVDGPPPAGRVRTAHHYQTRRQHSCRNRTAVSVSKPASETTQYNSITVYNDPLRKPPGTPQSRSGTPKGRSGTPKGRSGTPNGQLQKSQPSTTRTPTPRRKTHKRRLEAGREAENVGMRRPPAVRRSPRHGLQHQPVLRDVNTPSSRALVSSNAAVQYSFKHFTMPKPLRSTQKDATQSVTSSDGPTKPSDCPEVEMKPMLACKTQ